MKIIILILTILFFGCSEDVLTNDQKLANEIWDEIQGYETWAQDSTFAEIQSGNSPHGDYVQIWLNETVANFFKNPDTLENATLPLGSILVKEGYSDSDGKSLNKVTIMKKIDGYDPDHNNWFWAIYNEGGELAGKNGKESSCYNCHISGNDYLLFKTW